MVFRKRVLVGSIAGALMAMLLGGLGFASQPTDEVKVHESRILAQTYGAELKMALQTALANGGPIEALDVCKDQAPLIAARLSRQSGAKVERVSRRYRNPASAAEPWQVTALEQLELANEKDKSSSEYVRHEAGAMRYMKAIRIQPLCLTCHGEALSDEVVQALDQHYPHDMARNYALGDLRGAFSVTWPATFNGTVSQPNRVDTTNSSSPINTGTNP